MHAHRTITLLIALMMSLPFLSAQSPAPTMVSTGSLLSYYGFTGGTFNAGSDIVTKIPRTDRRTFGALDGDAYVIDTPEEFITAAYFSPVQIVDASALAAVEAVLPHNDPRTAGLKLGAMWYKKIVELQFCDPTNTAQLANYELAIRTISERTGVSRADMVTFFRNGINTVVAESVDREFNTISFMIDVTGKTYNAILTRNPQTGQYKLTYEGYWSGVKQTKELTAGSLDLLLAEMRRRPEDFNQACIDTVSNKVNVMPAVVFDNWKRISGGKIDCLPLIKEMITNFYLNPTEANMMLLAQVVGRTIKLNHTAPDFYTAFMGSFIMSIGTLSIALSRRVDTILTEKGPTYLAKLPMPDRYSPLWTPFSYGSGK